MTDFMIVGRGLAASVLMHEFYINGISFTTIGEPGLSSCSRVAGGIWNPVVFKRMSKSWMADKLIPKLNEFYKGCEERLGRKLLHHRDIIKPFTEEQEKTLWLKRAKNELAGFLDDEIKNETGNELRNCRLPGQYGVVKQAGYVDMPALLDGTSDFFGSNTITEIFDYDLLQIEPDCVRYRSLKARNVIFCEGFLVSNNPFFDWIPLKPAKGEILTLTASELDLGHSIFNRNGFIVRTGDNTFKTGATYAWSDLGQEPTEQGRAELLKKLEQMISCSYAVTSHQAGIRPSSIDRRPVAGTHPEYGNLFVFNGLGTKGVMLAPYFAENFVLFYLQKAVLDPVVDIKRFYSTYEAQKKKS